MAPRLNTSKSVPLDLHYHTQIADHRSFVGRESAIRWRHRQKRNGNAIAMGIIRPGRWAENSRTGRLFRDRSSREATDYQTSDLTMFYDLSVTGKYIVSIEIDDPSGSQDESGLWLRTNSAKFEMEAKGTMIAHLRGKLIYKQPGQAIVEAGGVGYDVAISVPTFTALPSLGAEASLYIHTQVSEDQIALFGFLEREEKRLFERLITVSGVGPKLAIKMLSGLSSDRTVQAIRGQDHAQLTRIPGVGKKLAERLVVELKDKLDDFAVAPVQSAVAGPAVDDVLSALTNLGYQRPAAEKAIAQAVEKDKALSGDFDGLFRGALKIIR